MPWITLTLDDLNRSLSAPERSALEKVAVEGADNPVQTVIAEIISEVRGYVASSGRVSLGAGATIPDKLKSAALARIRFESFTRLPIGRSLLTEDRVAANEAAVRLLERCADGKFSVDEPTEASTETIGSAKPSFGEGRNSNWTRGSQEGL